MYTMYTYVMILTLNKNNVDFCCTEVTTVICDVFNVLVSNNLSQSVVFDKDFNDTPLIKCIKMYAMKVSLIFLE